MPQQCAESGVLRQPSGPRGRTRRPRRVRMCVGGLDMDSTTLLIVIVVLVLLFGGGGGYYGRRAGWGGPHYGGGLLGLIIVILLLLWLTGNLGGPGRIRPRVQGVTPASDGRS